MAYGFIEPDDDELDDVFVHWNSIVSADDDDETPFYPFLLQKEQVRFTTEDVKEKQPRARNVAFEDGSLVPRV